MLVCTIWLCMIVCMYMHLCIFDDCVCSFWRHIPTFVAEIIRCNRAYEGVDVSTYVCIHTVFTMLCSVFFGLHLQENELFEMHVITLNAMYYMWRTFGVRVIHKVSWSVFEWDGPQYPLSSSLLSTNNRPPPHPCRHIPSIFELLDVAISHKRPRTEEKFYHHHVFAHTKQTRTHFRLERFQSHKFRSLCNRNSLFATLTCQRIEVAVVATTSTFCKWVRLR